MRFRPKLPPPCLRAERGDGEAKALGSGAGRPLPGPPIPVKRPILRPATVDDGQQVVYRDSAVEILTETIKSRLRAMTEPHLQRRRLPRTCRYQLGRAVT